MGMAEVKALCFDVFGTVVDWRGSIAREVEALFALRGIDGDGHAFADAWRARYQPVPNVSSSAHTNSAASGVPTFS
jgi:2-haloacid dehalogenase